MNVTEKAGNMTSSQLPSATFDFDQTSILKQMRLCRSTLGAILEELESAPRNPRALEALSEAAASVTAEIERLWDITKCSG